MDRRGPEDTDDRVADELLDRSAVRLDPPTREGVVRAQEPVDVLGIEPLAELRRPDDVAEQDGDGLAFFSRGGRYRFPALGAEPERLGAEVPATVTAGHAPSLRTG